MIDVELPRDAEGLEIPLSTKELYHLDGTKSEVVCFSYWQNGPKWKVILCDLFGNHATSEFLLYPPDSWEQLEHDARLAPRDYLQARGLEEQKDGRIATMMGDLVSRAKALAEREKKHD